MIWSTVKLNRSYIWLEPVPFGRANLLGLSTIGTVEPGVLLQHRIPAGRKWHAGAEAHDLCDAGENFRRDET